MRHNKTKKFALMGYPLQYSLSPQIHILFAEQFGLNIFYDALETTADNLFTAIQDFFAAGGHGLNITAPYKEVVYLNIARLNTNAKITQAINTVFLQADGTLSGDNTDGLGFVRDTIRNNMQLRNSNILILGAGGAVRGILPQLIALYPNEIVVCNRNVHKAIKMSQDFVNSNIKLINSFELTSVKPDVIIHAISADFADAYDEIYKKINFKNCVCYDLNYGPKSSNFLAFAAANGARQMINGLGMLVEQAAEAFYLWHGLKPETNKVLAYIQQITV